MSFGENLRRLRLQHNYTQTQLGEWLGVTGENITRYEKGLSYPRVSILIAISQLFNTPIDELLDNRLSPAKAIVNELNQLLNGIYTIKDIGAEHYSIKSKKQKFTAVISLERLVEIEHNMKTDTEDIITALLKQSAIRECEKVFKDLEHQQAILERIKAGEQLEDILKTENLLYHGKTPSNK